MIHEEGDPAVAESGGSVHSMYVSLLAETSQSASPITTRFNCLCREKPVPTRVMLVPGTPRCGYTAVKVGVSDSRYSNVGSEAAVSKRDDVVKAIKLIHPVRGSGIGHPKSVFRNRSGRS